jgi:hypothetical protein
VKYIQTNNLFSSFTLEILEYVAREMATNFKNSVLSKIKAGLRRKVKPKRKIFFTIKCQICQQLTIKLRNTYDEKKSLWKMLQLQFGGANQDLIFSEKIINYIKLCLDFEKLKEGEIVNFTF